MNEEQYGSSINMSTDEEVMIPQEQGKEAKRCNTKRMLFSILITLFGLTTIGNTAYFALLKIKFDLQPEELNAYTFIATISFILKPFYGLLTDKVYICGKHRKPYIIICGLASSMLWMYLGFWVTSSVIATIVMCANNAQLAIIVSVSEALLVEDSQVQYKKTNSKPSDNVSLYFFLDGISLMIISYLTGILMDNFPLKAIFGLCAAFSALMMVCGLCYKEGNSSDHTPIKEHFKNLWIFIRKKTVYLPILFIFLCGLTPSTYDAITYFYMNVLGFNFEMLGRNNLMSNIGYLIGIVIYNKYLKRKPFKKIVMITTLLVAAFNMAQLFVIFRLNRFIGIPDIYAVMIISMISNSFLEINTLPLLTLSCILCPKNNEAFIFETIMGLKSLSYSISYKSGGNLMAILSISSTNFDSLWIMIIISSLFPLIAIVFLMITPIKTDYSQEFRVLGNVTNRTHLNAIEENIKSKKGEE